MTGKTNIYIVSFWFCFWPSSVFAILGAGDIVSDPASYAYYVEQIAQLSQQLTEMKELKANSKETLETNQKIKEQAEGTYSSVAGLYDKGQRYIKRFQSIQDLLNSNPRNLEGQYSKWVSLVRKGVNLNSDSVDLLNTPEESISVNFRDPRDPLFKHLEEIDLRYQIRQSSLKNSIASAESILAGTNGRMANAKQLASEIDSANSLKEAQDLNNAFLAEILIILNELLTVTAHMAESQGMLDFHGVNDDIMASRADIINSSEDRAEERSELLIKAFEDRSSAMRAKSTFKRQEGDF